MTEPLSGDRGRSAMNPDIIARAEALRRLPSTRSDLAEELERGLALTRDGDPAAAPVLTAAVEAVSGFKHIVPVDGGFAFSLYVRGLLDSASWALEWPSTPPEIAALIHDAERLIEQGREEGVVAMEAALSQVP